MHLHVYYHRTNRGGRHLSLKQLEVICFHIPQKCGLQLNELSWLHVTACFHLKKKHQTSGCNPADKNNSKTSNQINKGFKIAVY